MICGTCKAAGKRKTEHFSCPGYINKTWCDCQHKDQGVNTLLVRKENNEPTQAS